MTGLFHELMAARRLARSADLAPALQACGLPIDTGPVWGVEFVELAGDYYQPRDGGRPAVIVPSLMTALCWT